jgi:hypothetical protein
MILCHLSDTTLTTIIAAVIASVATISTLLKAAVSADCVRSSVTADIVCALSIDMQPDVC